MSVSPIQALRLIREHLNDASSRSAKAPYPAEHITSLIDAALETSARRCTPEAWMLDFDDEKPVTTNPSEVEMWRTQHDHPYTPVALSRCACPTFPADSTFLSKAEILSEQKRMIDDGTYDAVAFAQRIENMTLHRAGFLRHVKRRSPQGQRAKEAGSARR